jgi:hypothetical protein
MFGVFQNIDPPPPLTARRTHSLGGEGGGGQYFRRRQIQLCRYSTYVSTLWVRHSSVNQPTSFVKVELNCSPTLAPLNPRRPNLRLSSTEVMASLLPPLHFFSPALRAPSPPSCLSSQKRIFRGVPGN